jgi:superfamily II DNA or RNA helicase/HKD family nuclease
MLLSRNTGKNGVKNIAIFKSRLSKLMDVKFFGKGEMPKIIEEIITDSLEISIASAFMNFTGLSILEKFLTKYQQIKKIDILLDEDFHPDENFKKALLSKLSNFPNTDIRIFCDEKKFFHSKIYCFKGDEKIKVIVGSSNLTGGGLLHNIEMNALFISDANDPEIKRLNSMYKKYWDRSVPAKVYLKNLEGSMTTANFKLGDKVIISNKQDFGIGKIVGIEGNQVDIYFKNKGIGETAHVNEIQLALDPLDMLKEGRFDLPRTFDFRTKALLLSFANVNGILSNSVIEILPHQILAAHKIISSASRRFLLADEVGLGKTFEAGIITKELMSRGEAERVLIITPAGLVDQWHEDMEKFGFDFPIYKSGLENAIKNFWNKMNNVIVSIDTIKIDENLQNAINSKDWDIIIFDEAHHLTRKDYSLKADKSDRYIVAERLKDKTKSLLLLTATPHQGDRNKFYNLVNLLDEEMFEDENNLFYSREKLNEIMIRQRKIDVTDEEGKPLFVKRIVKSLRHDISAEEKLFFTRLNDYLMSGYKSAEQDVSTRYRALGFVMTTFQKIAASSIYAVRAALLDRLIRLLFIEIEKTKDDSIVPNLKSEICKFAKYKYDTFKSDKAIYAAEKINFDKYVKKENIDPVEFLAAPDEIDSLKELLSEVPIDEDTKLTKLVDAIRSMKKTNSDKKVIIFTEYLNTQDYIVRKLRDEYGDSDVVFIRGGDHKEKARASKAFKKNAHFLVSTQAGGEGINLQHCHIIINYDMPWNPMKVEQRIGRVHRYKQKDTVNVYNIFGADTIEDRIYQRLDDKLYEITQAIGDEDEKEAYRENILGIIAEELNFDELYKDVLKKGQEIDEITKEKIDAAVERAKDVYQKLGDFTQDMEKFDLQKYFKTKGDFSLNDVKDFVLEFAKSEGKKISNDEDGNYEFIIPDAIPSYGGYKYKRITFDRDRAVEDPSLEFMALGHHITDLIFDKCMGYGYTGRCVKRQILDSELTGESGIQINVTIEYQTSLPGDKKNKTLKKDFHTLIFDSKLNYREDLKRVSLIESQKKYNEKDFSFATKEFVKQSETASQERIQQIIDNNIETLQKTNPNVIHKKSIENVALFSCREPI